VTTLRSTFDPTSRTITLELELSEALPSAALLALTSIVQLTPGPTSGAVLVRRLATYHELAPVEDLPVGATWVMTDLAPSHVPNHANDGPVSAFLVRTDGRTTPVQTEPMRRVGGDRTSDTRRRPDTDSETDWDLVPYPAELHVPDATRSAESASFGGGPDVARRAWEAVAAVVARRGGSHLAVDAPLRVSATLDENLTAEAYRLTIDGNAIVVGAAGGPGFRHAFVTLAQWLAAGVPTRGFVHDAPRYAFRGLHVDLARQWFEPEVVERLIEDAAWRKLSHLHLHLTDDEAWRIPVESYPDLAAIGATRGHGLPLPPMLGGGAEPVGRAYTAPEIARWVERADQLGVVLVPEVDLPAHMHAALTALPQLRDPDDSSGAISVQYFVDNVLVPGHPETTPFVEAVVDAVAGLFPTSPYIHIGGDEVPHDAWGRSPIVDELKRAKNLASVADVEAEFHRDLVKTIRRRSGRRVGGWQEAALAGGISPDDGYVVGWRTVEVCRELAAAGFDVVISPAQAYYLDIAVDDAWPTPGASWAGSTSLARVCEFDPERGWSDDERVHLLGVQACLWTETVPDERTLHAFLFPRLDAIAERGWTGRIQGGAPSLARRAQRIARPTAP
jgi:hexosaminidase